MKRVVREGARIHRDVDADGKSAGPLRIWPGGYATTRCIGNLGAPASISPEPAFSGPIAVPTTGGALVMCSDGVWDRLDSEHVAEIVLKGPASATSAARKIVERASRSGLADDKTAVVMLISPIADESVTTTYLASSCDDDAKTVHLGFGASHRVEREQSRPRNYPVGAPRSECAWTAYDGHGLACDLRHGKRREQCAIGVLAAANQRKPSTFVARVLRSWWLLGSSLQPYSPPPRGATSTLRRESLSKHHKAASPETGAKKAAPQGLPAAVVRAVKYGQAHVLRSWLDIHASGCVGWTDECGNEALHYAAMVKDSEAMVRLLLERGACINRRLPATGSTPLLIATIKWCAHTPPRREPVSCSLPPSRSLRCTPHHL